MSDWIGNIISGIALAVSGLSLFISIRTAQRAINAAKVTAWIDPLERTGSSEWLLATLNIKNPSHTDIKVEKVGIDLPDFRVGDVDEASVDDGYGNRVLPEDIVVKNHRSRWLSEPVKRANARS